MMSAKFLQIEDIFRLEQIGRYFGGGFSFLPDRKTLAYVLQRAKETTKNHKQDFLWGNDRADIWLVDLATSKSVNTSIGHGGLAPLLSGETPPSLSVNLTEGINEDVGYWSPAWSPDGKYLAMLSTKEGNVTLWVWHKTTGSLQQLTTRGINFENVRDRPYTWISNTEIICTILPENEQPWGMACERDASKKAWQGSQAANRGEEVTVSVLQSGVAVDITKREGKTSIVVNIVENTSKTLVEGNTQEYNLSPDKNWLACLETVDIRQPQTHLPLSFETGERYAVTLIALQDGEQKRLQVSNDVLANSLCWSPNSDLLAFIGYELERNCPPKVYIYNSQNDTVQTRGSKKLNAAPLIRNSPHLLWTVDNKLLVYAARTEEAQPTPQDRYDWWLLVCDGDTTQRFISSNRK
jgi:Tol biopolymer transport system component